MAKTTPNKKQLFFVNSPIRKTTESPPCLCDGTWPLRWKTCQWTDNTETPHNTHLLIELKTLPRLLVESLNPPIIESTHSEMERSKGLNNRIFPLLSKYLWNPTSLESYVKRTGPIETLREWNRKSNTMTANLQAHDVTPQQPDLANFWTSGSLWLVGGGG